MSDARDDIRRARAGDRGAIDRLLARCTDALRRHAEARVGPGLRAKIRVSDLLQTTYADVLASLDRFPGTTESEFRAYAVASLENNIRDKVKYFDRDRRKGEQQGLPEVLPAENGRGPATEVRDADELALVERALERLAPDRRRVIELVLLEEKSHREAARTLGRTELATRALLKRARADLMVEVERLRSAAD